MHLREFQFSDLKGNGVSNDSRYENLVAKGGLKAAGSADLLGYGVEMEMEFYQTGSDNGALQWSLNVNLVKTFSSNFYEGKLFGVDASAGVNMQFRGDGPPTYKINENSCVTNETSVKVPVVAPGGGRFVRADYNYSTNELFIGGGLKIENYGEITNETKTTILEIKK